MNQSPIFVSVEEGARMLNLCRATFYKLLGDGRVSKVKLGRRTLIPVQSIREYATSLQDNQPTPAS